MSNLTGLTALDVAIGLIFLYVLLSIVCSTLNELIAGVLGWRAKNLQVAIRNLVADPALAKEFWNHPRIQVLAEPRRRTTRAPSYIPAHVFALVALDTFAPAVAEAARKRKPGSEPSHDLLGNLRNSIEKVHVPSVKRALGDVLDEGRTELDDLRAGLEKSFDEVMDRASGWYKRKAQRALLLIATAVTLAGNVDTVHVASRLWNDDALRAMVVQRAATAPGQQAPASADDLETLADNVGEVNDLQLPLGWDSAALPESFWEWVAKVVIGWPVTILALTLGAPFWFDVLGKVARLRATGNREGTQKDNDRAPEDRDDPGPRRGLTPSS